MLLRSLQFLFDHAERDTEAVGDLLPRQAFQAGCNKDGALSRRQRGNRRSNQSKIGASLHNALRAWCFVGDMEQCLDVNRAQPPDFGAAPVKSVMNGGPEKISPRIADPPERVSAVEAQNTYRAALPRPNPVSRGDASIAVLVRHTARLETRVTSYDSAGSRRQDRVPLRACVQPFHRPPSDAGQSTTPPEDRGSMIIVKGCAIDRSTADAAACRRWLHHALGLPSSPAASG